MAPTEAGVTKLWRPAEITKRTAFTFIWLVIVAIIGYQVLQNIPPDFNTFSNFSVTRSSLGVFLGILGGFPSVWIVKDCLLTQKDKTPMRTAAILTFLPAIAKYVPGKIWSALGFIILADYLAGVRKSSGAAFQIYFHLLGLFSSSLLLLSGITAMQFVAENPKLSNFTLGSLVLLLASLIALAVTLKLLHEHHQLHTWRQVGLHLGAITTQKLIRGAALLVFLTAWMDLWGNALKVMLAFVAAMQAGVLAFFSPAGLGVNEGVYTFLLSDSLGLRVALTVALLARLWQTLLDLALGGAGYLLQRHVTHQSLDRNNDRQERA
jgi:hypothetical protein